MASTEVPKLEEKRKGDLSACSSAALIYLLPLTSWNLPPILVCPPLSFFVRGRSLTQVIEIKSSLTVTLQLTDRKHLTKGLLALLNEIRSSTLASPLTNLMEHFQVSRATVE